MIKQTFALAITLLILASFIGLANAATPSATYDPDTYEHQSLTLYMRSDTYTTNEVSGYGLDTDYTNTYASIASNITGVANVTYGFRVYLYSATTTTELTSGTPAALINIYGNYTGQLSGNWYCPDATTILGVDAIKVVVYLYSGSTWNAMGTFVTNHLMANGLVGSLWTFQLNVDITQTSYTYATFGFGDTDYRSLISGLVIEKPLESEVQMYRLSAGDLIGFALGGYADVLGADVVYIIALFGICAAFYRRYTHFGVVAFFFILFAGPGGLLIVFLPVWAILPIAVILILGCTFMLWRVLR